MNGRIFFEKFSFFITSFSALLTILPRFVRIFLFDLLAGMPGKLGIFSRYLFLRSLAKTCGANVYVGRWCTLKNIDNLTVGNNVSIHDGCYIDAQGGVEIGDDVSIAHSSSVLSFEHTFDIRGVSIKYQPLKFKKVLIRDDVWIGSGCRILAGSVIQSQTVIGANSLVNKKIDSGVYVGSPVRKIKEL